MHTKREIRKFFEGKLEKERRKEKKIQLRLDELKAEKRNKELALELRKQEMNRKNEMRQERALRREQRKIRFSRFRERVTPRKPSFSFFRRKKNKPVITESGST